MDELITNKIFSWKCGDALIVNRTFIHCSSKIKKSKLGLTIFFNRKLNSS